MAIFRRLPRAMVASLPALAAGLAGGLILAAGAPAAVGLAGAVLAALGGGWIALRRTPGDGAERAGKPGRRNLLPRETRDVLDVLPFGVIVVARDGHLRRVNESAVETFRLPASDWRSASMLRVPALLDAIEAGFRDGAEATVEFSLPRAEGGHYRAHLRPLPDGDLGLAIEDRTEARLGHRLHRDFIADASHELKTPLAALSGLIETLQGSARDDPEATAHFLGLLDAQARRMIRLVEDLLSLNRVEQNARLHPREPQDIALIVGETVEALRPLAEAADIRLLLAEPGADPAPRITGERGDLEQLVRNLVENAISHGGAGAEVRVGVAAAPATHPGMVMLSVRDTGPGIAPEHIPRLTERFYRVSASRSRRSGGTGLGLAIVKHIVARHRGRLEIESRPGKGSCFTVFLPTAGGR